MSASSEVDGVITYCVKLPMMTVICHKAAVNTQVKQPVILIHGEHYTGNIWGDKPDGDKGWAYDFAKAGFEVYCPTLPLNGNPDDRVLALKEAGGIVKRLQPGFVESMMTAPAKVKRVNWPTRDYHTQWPGTGRRGDPIFDKFMSGTVPVYLDRQERESMGQRALVSLLRRLRDPAVLIGHGSGANLAWLAADLVPKRVATIIAIEPLGPPFGNARKRMATGQIQYDYDFSEPEIQSNLDSFGIGSTKDLPRRYGIADIPLTFDPPPLAPTYELLGENFQPIPYKLVSGHEPGQYYFLQDLQSNSDQAARPRQLVNLKGIPQILWTSPASFHRTFDWATKKFLQQAGVNCLHRIPKEEYGNGHLCFLEKNSRVISKYLISWIKDKVPSDLDQGQSPPHDLAIGRNEAPTQGQTSRAPTHMSQNQASGKTHSNRGPVARVHDDLGAVTNAKSESQKRLHNVLSEVPLHLPREDAERADYAIQDATTEGRYNPNIGEIARAGVQQVADDTQESGRTPASAAEEEPLTQPINAANNPTMRKTLGKKPAAGTRVGKKRGPYKKTLEKRALAAAQAAGVNYGLSKAAEPTTGAKETSHPAAILGPAPCSLQASHAAAPYSTASFEPSLPSPPQPLIDLKVVGSASASKDSSFTPGSGFMVTNHDNGVPPPSLNFQFGSNGASTAGTLDVSNNNPPPEPRFDDQMTAGADPLAQAITSTSYGVL